MVLLLLILVSLCYMYLVIYRKDRASVAYSFAISRDQTMHKKAE